jgi:hypothetical protein
MLASNQQAWDPIATSSGFFVRKRATGPVPTRSEMLTLSNWRRRITFLVLKYFDMENGMPFVTSSRQLEKLW